VPVFVLIILKIQERDLWLDELFAVSLLGLFIQLTKRCGNPAEAWLAIKARFHGEPYSDICRRTGVKIILNNFNAF
jgi:hypothetical protein